MNPNFLIADDDPVVRLILTAILESFGHSVVAVETGAECLNVINQEMPKLLFLDHQLPDMSGGEILKTLRANHPTLKVIMLSANSEDELKSISPGMNPDYFLEKPFTGDTVKAALDAVLAD